MQSEVEKSIRLTLQDEFGISDIENSDNLSDQLDSLDIVELVMIIEEEFDIEIDDNKLVSIVSLDDLIGLVEGYVYQGESE
jgi:acyl carrier protein